MPSHAALARIASALAALAALAAAVTIIVPDWIEAVFGVDPDAHSSAAEWGITLLLAAVAVCLGLFARRHHRLAHT